MPTLVETFLQVDEPTYKKALAALVEYLKAPERAATVRLAIYGLAAGTQWKATGSLYNSLFPKDRRVELTEHRMSRFVEGRHGAHDDRFAALFSLLVVHEVAKNPDLKKNIFMSAAYTVNDTLHKVSAYLAHGAAEILFPPADALPYPLLISQCRHQFGLSGDDGAVARLIFGPTGVESHRLNDYSYYALYRYGSIRGRIVKTFLAIMSPQVGPYGCFSFTHVYRQNDRKPLRTTRGGVVSFDEAIYLFGASSTNVARTKPITHGLKAMVIPHASILNDHRCAAGLFLSNAGDWRPLLGRVALLHIGFQSEIGPLDHEKAGIKVLPDEAALCADVDAHCQRWFDLAERKDEVGVIQERVLRYMNNCPSEDRTTDLSQDGILRALATESED